MKQPKKSTNVQTAGSDIALQSSTTEAENDSKSLTTTTQAPEPTQQQPEPEKAPQIAPQSEIQPTPEPTPEQLETAKAALKKKAYSTTSSKGAAAAVRKAAQPKEEKRPPGRPPGTTKEAQEQKRLDEEIFTRDNVVFYLERANELLEKIALNCSGKELNHFIDPVHRIVNKKFGNAKFFNTDEGQLAVLALATFGPKIPGAIKKIRGKFDRSSIRDEQTRENVPTQPKSEGSEPGNVSRSDGTILRWTDFPEQQRTSGVL